MNNSLHLLIFVLEEQIQKFEKTDSSEISKLAIAFPKMSTSTELPNLLENWAIILQNAD